MNEDRLPIILSPEADQDLLDIWGRLSQAISLTIADKQLREIERLCLAICDWPEYGRGREDLRKGLRSAPVGRYVVFFLLFDFLDGCWSTINRAVNERWRHDGAQKGDVELHILEVDRIAILIECSGLWAVQRDPSLVADNSPLDLKGVGIAVSVKNESGAQVFLTR